MAFVKHIKFINATFSYYLLEFLDTFFQHHQDLTIIL
jgi:hypothetical protein